MLQQAFNFNNGLYNTLFPKVIYPLAGFSMTGNQQNWLFYHCMYTTDLVIIHFFCDNKESSSFHCHYIHLFPQLPPTLVCLLLLNATYPFVEVKLTVPL